MAYNVYFACDKCGAIHSWINHSLSISIATSIARSYGWSVGKKGWFCPECRKTRVKHESKTKKQKAMITNSRKRRHENETRIKGNSPGKTA